MRYNRLFILGACGTPTTPGGNCYPPQNIVGTLKRIIIHPISIKRVSKWLVG